MGKPSPFFSRIKRHIVSIISTIPEGRLTSFKDIGAHLDVMPRHVTYILATPDPVEAAILPWFRAVPDQGLLLTPKAGPDGRSQRELLTFEGHSITADGRILSFGGNLVVIGTLPHGVAVQKRPVDAPKASRNSVKAPIGERR